MKRQVIRWRYKLPVWVADALDGDPTLISQQMYGFFVVGAPAFITQNFSTESLICNGTSCEMMSVGYYSRSAAAEYDSAIAGGSLLAEVPIPDFIVVKLPNGVLFPVTITDEMELRVGGISFVVKVHGVDIGFACTFHKVQGLTLDYVVLHLSRCSTLRTASVHVGMSRVTTKKKMRLFPLKGGLDHVRQRKWSNELKNYMAKLI